MLVIDTNTAETISGLEGTKIKQIFHPHNTMLGIRYSIVHCTLGPGKSTKPHKLKSSEVYFVTNGTGTIHVDDECADVRPGKAVYVQPYSKQYIRNSSDAPLEFLCIVDPAWRQEDELYD